MGKNHAAERRKTSSAGDNAGNSRLRGVLFVLGAAACFAGMSAAIRLAGELPTFEKAFFRNFIAAIAAGIVIRRSHLTWDISREARPTLFFRAFFGAVGLFCNFYAIDHLRLADATMLNKLNPFFAVFFSIFLLKEKIRPFQVLTLIGAFLGAMCIIKPAGACMEAVPGFIGLLGGAGAGLAYTLVRKCSRQGVASPLIVFFFSVFSCVVCVPFIAADFVMPSGTQFLFLLLCGLFAAGGQFCVTAAYTHAPAREISVYDYAQVIFSAALGFVLFGQVPDALSFLGYGIILAMAIINFAINNRLVPEGKANA